MGCVIDQWNLEPVEKVSHLLFFTIFQGFIHIHMRLIDAKDIDGVLPIWL